MIVSRHLIFTDLHVLPSFPTGSYMALASSLIAGFLLVLVSSSLALHMEALQRATRASLAAATIALGLLEGYPATAAPSMLQPSTIVLSDSQEIDFSTFLSYIDNGKISRVVFKGYYHAITSNTSR